MIRPLVSNGNPNFLIDSTIRKAPPRSCISYSRPINCSLPQNPTNTINKRPSPQTHLINPIVINSNHVSPRNMKKDKGYVDRRGSSQVGGQQILLLCGFGYWLQGFRCFPWLALNLHMAHNLNLHPSTLQLVQNSGNLPMMAKPLYGILSDAFYIGGDHRIPYISIGVLLQVLSWGPLALVPVAGELLPTLMVYVLLSNIGASITEVAKDALVAEYGQKHKLTGLQSYAFMALAAGGILGNLLGGFFLQKTQQPKSMFLVFAALLVVQLMISSATKEESLGLPQPSSHSLVRKSISDSIREQYSELMMAISEISHPLAWIVASIAIVPVLSGSLFCCQTRCLGLDPSIIGMSRVTGQMMLLSMIILYNRFWRSIPMRKLIGTVQTLYAFSLLLDLILVKQLNLKLGIPNDIFALCFSGLAETIAQFKILPFQVFFASLAPLGCEASLTSLLASVLCSSSIISGFLGIGLASLLGITSDDYSSLPVGIMVQFLAALVPLRWIYHVPMSQTVAEKERMKGRSRRTRRNRRVGRVVFGSGHVYRRERESEAHR